MAVAAWAYYWVYLLLGMSCMNLFYWSVLVTMVLRYNLKSDIVISPALLFLLRFDFAIQGLYILL
jgi:hypothetical protein